MAAMHILQPNYFILQPNSLSFAFIAHEQSEWAQCYSDDKKGAQLAIWSTV